MIIRVNTNILCSAEIKVLELKKKLSSLNKKWGKNKTENFHRILFMGENEVYVSYLNQMYPYI